MSEVRNQKAHVFCPRPSGCPPSSVLCLLCLLLCFLTSFTAAETSSGQLDPNTDANLPGRKPEKSPQSSLFIAKSPTTDLGRQLWQTRISAYKGQTDGKSKNELQRLIELIRSVEFKPQEQPPETVAVIKTVQETEPAARRPADNQTVPVQVRQATKEIKIQPKPAPGSVSDETLQLIRNKLQHPEQLKNPFGLGEILFRTGHLKEAVVCYQQALARKDPNQPDQNQNTPWLLLQIGNCLRKDDAPKAVEFYTRLINEYPDSLWTDLAKARSKLITWYQQDKPETLIRKKQKQPTDSENEKNPMLMTKSQSETEQPKGG